MSVESVNWQEIEAKLPYQRDEESLASRKELFDQFDVNHNGYLSLAEVDKGLGETLQLDSVFDAKPVINRAFHAALKHVHGDTDGHSFLKKKEFRVFLEFLQRHFELWVMFETIDSGMDRRVDLEEFMAALPKLEEWGVAIEDENAPSVFSSIDSNSGGQVDFPEFCTWAIGQKLQHEKAEAQSAATVTEANIRDDFQKYDLTGNGTITKEELVAVFMELSPDMRLDKVEQLLGMANLDGSDVVDYSKFISWMFDSADAVPAQ